MSRESPSFGCKPGRDSCKTKRRKSSEDCCYRRCDARLIKKKGIKQIERERSNRKVHTCSDAYAKQHNPIEKQVTDRTRKTRGDRLIQIKTHQGTRWPGERLQCHVIRAQFHNRLSFNESKNALHCLLPCESEKTVNSSPDTKNQGSKPETVDRICYSGTT